MTDTHAPMTGPQPSPMFDTGPHPSPSPTTEPNPSPIFDTGPHPGPLQQWGSGPPSISQPQAVLADAITYSVADAEADADHVEAEAEAEAEVEAEAEAAEPDGDPYADPPADPDVDPDVAEAAAQLGAERDETPEAPAPQAFSELDSVDTDAFLRSVTGHLRSSVVVAQPVVVPSSFQFVKRWKFALIVAGVWLVSAAAGLGFYYWWYTSLTKTVAVFGILLYLMVCMVASILVSMIPNRPQVTALSIALMSAPLASVAAAAVLHGAYFFEWITRPVIG